MIHYRYLEQFKGCSQSFPDSGGHHDGLIENFSLEVIRLV